MEVAWEEVPFQADKYNAAVKNVTIINSPKLSFGDVKGKKTILNGLKYIFTEVLRPKYRKYCYSVLSLLSHIQSIIGSKWKHLPNTYPV